MLIKDISAREILDSRGQPTLEVDIYLEDGSFGRASIPAGASKGKNEAIELRDHDPERFNGKGLLKSIKLINNEIKPNLIGLNSYNQSFIDDLLIKLDGTPDKSRLGANSLLATSFAVARASAQSANLPLFRYIGGVAGNILPTPLINIINGGMHAHNRLTLQEFMILPVKAKNFLDSMQIASKIFYNLKDILISKNYNSNYGDEGGFAPELDDTRQALNLISEACIKSNYKMGEDIFLGLDSAASEFYKDGFYHLSCENKKFDSSEIIEFYVNLIDEFPIISLEDPLSEDDIEGWQEITKLLGSKIQLIGDDLFATNINLLKKGIEKNLANAILIKPNQIGTLSETLNTINLAKSHNYNTIISHRSGETEDSIISHIAVATNSGQIKAGSVCRTDRVAKYNELLRINEIIGFDFAKFAGKPIINKK